MDKERIREKALSLMGDRRIKFKTLHKGASGVIVGIADLDSLQKPPRLNIVLDSSGKTTCSVEDFRQVFLYEGFDVGIKAMLSEDGRRITKEPSYLAGRFEKFDLPNKDYDFRLATNLAPMFTTWEMIKTADHVSVYCKNNEEGDHFMVEASTERGLFVATVPLDHLVSCGEPLDQLPWSPAAAIAAAKKLIKEQPMETELGMLSL